MVDRHGTALQYGGGLRLLEALRIRAEDLDFERGEFTVREGKGDKDRVTTMPRAVVKHLQEHLQRVKTIHQQDVADGYGRVQLPHALARKPSASIQILINRVRHLYRTP